MRRGGRGREGRGACDVLKLHRAVHWRSCRSKVRVEVLVHLADRGGRRSKRGSQLVHLWRLSSRVHSWLGTVESDRVRCTHTVRRSSVHHRVWKLSSVEIDSCLLSPLNKLSLIRSCLELLSVGDGLVPTLLPLLCAVRTAVKIAVALDFSASPKAKQFKRRGICSAGCPMKPSIVKTA